MAVGPTLHISVPKYGVATPAPTGLWAISLTSNDTDPSDGILFHTPPSMPGYHLRLAANADLTIWISGGEVDGGQNTVYTWSLVGPGNLLLANGRYTAPGPVALYRSQGPISDARLYLLSVETTVHDLQAFTPAAIQTSLQVTFAAAEP